MSCEPVCSCGCGAPVLALTPPPPGETRLRRRVGEFHGFVEDLVASVERQEIDGATLGTKWDIEADPAALRLVELWAYVAETIAAYGELTAGEAYLPTAQDWTDLRRIAALVGFAPRPPIAAQGWVVADVESTTSPVVPAGTRVQAPAKPGGASQTFEVIADTALLAEWAGLTATWVPQPAIPSGRSIRFIGDPGFRAADRVLFVLEQQASLPAVGPAWTDFWGYLFELVALSWDYVSPAKAQAVALTTVGSASAELGTTVVGFDRDLDKLLGESTTAPYAAYRVLGTASVARQISEVLRVPASGDATTANVPTTGELEPDAISGDRTQIILDRPLEDLSKNQLVAVVDWASSSCDVVEVSNHSFTHWEIVPGTPTRVSKLQFASGVATLGQSGPITVYVLDRRVVARHYVFPDDDPGSSPPQLRLYPRPTEAPQRVAVASSTQADADWEVYDCTPAALQETDDGGQPSGLIVDLPNGAPEKLTGLLPASGNLLRVHHGKTASVVLGSGDASQAGQELTTPDSPIAYDLDESGTPVPSLLLRVDGLEWDEAPTLYGAGPADVFSVRRAPTGAETLVFGDGVEGARLPTGRGNVAATYRVGGGRQGEVESGAITTLLGSIRGVKKVKGAGPTEGGADQDAESDLRRLAPTRARAFGRVVSAEDLVDLALGYPGVTHAATWSGQGPPGCTCGSGLHLALIRSGTSGPRPPLPAEIDQLSGYLDSVRDAAVPLCVCAGVVTTPTLTAVLATDPRRDPATVVAAVTAALADPDGPLGPGARVLGQPLDRSDVFAVIHEVAGVVGVASLDLPGADAELGRLAAKPYELLVPSATPVVTGAPA